MIPYNPNAPGSLWFLAWRQAIRNAKANPKEMWGYCQAAVLAQGQFVCYMAISVNDEANKK